MAHTIVEWIRDNGFAYGIMFLLLIALLLWLCPEWVKDIFR